MSQSDQILRTGVLFKKGSGSGILGRKNWKPRYFVLTPAKLKYFTFEDGDLRGEVDLTGCDEGMVEVMPMDSMKTGSSASTIWRIAVNAPERRLLVAAGTEMEMNDWVDKLMMAFRINNGQPMHLPQRGSMNHLPNALHDGFNGASSGGSLNSNVSNVSNGSGAPGSGNGGASITDFQNFTIARRMHHGGRQSMGVNSEYQQQQRLSDEQQQQQQLHAAQVRVDSQRQAEEEQEMVAQRQQYEADQLRAEEIEREQAYMIEQTRRHEEAKREAAEAAAILQQQDAARQRQQQEEEEARRYHEEALRQEAEEEQQRLALQMQLQAVEREREEEQQRREAEIQAEQQRQNQEALLEAQRRQKREKHERERAEREEQIRELERQELEKQKAQQAAQSYSFEQGDSGEEYDLDDSEEEEVAPVPRSSLIGEAKREAMMKQQAEHQRRREAALKEEQRRQRDQELEKKIASVQLNAGGNHREVEIPPRVVEIVRRAPPAPAAAAVAQPEAARLSVQKLESFEL